MRHYFDVEALITKATDLPDCWVAWCPTLDVATQGVSPDHAAAMLEDAITIITSSALSNMRSADGDTVDKVVRHPIRFAEKADQDEDWEKYQDLVKMKKALLLGSFSLREELSDGRDDTILLQGWVDVESRCGVIKVRTNMDHYGYVPSVKMVVKYTERPRKNERLYETRRSLPLGPVTASPSLRTKLGISDDAVIEVEIL